MTMLRKLGCGLAVGCFLASFAAAPAAARCSTTLAVTLQERSSGVTVELRRGTPGSSRVVSRKQSVGGHVNFGGLCPGSYFMAIGDQDEVEVTPVHQFADNMRYQSTISVQRGTGNVGHRKRGEL